MRRGLTLLSCLGLLIYPLTRNDKTKLDPALIRPGRVDVSFEFKNANKAVSREIFKVFYPVTGKFPIIDGEPGRVQGGGPLLGVDAEIASSSYFISDLAEKFAAAIPEGEFSPAAILGKCVFRPFGEHPRLPFVSVLTGFLLSYKTSPQAAVDNVHSWVVRSREQVAKTEGDSNVAA